MHARTHTHTLLPPPEAPRSVLRDPQSAPKGPLTRDCPSQAPEAALGREGEGTTGEAWSFCTRLPLCKGSPRGPRSRPGTGTGAGTGRRFWKRGSTGRWWRGGVLRTPGPLRVPGAARGAEPEECFRARPRAWGVLAGGMGSRLLGFRRGQHLPTAHQCVQEKATPSSPMAVLAQPARMEVRGWDRAEGPGACSAPPWVLGRDRQ